ncbi:unnamed protein product [Mytilus edulis]|uniref:Reverse transcriptase domain-containing protein n=1 Tax=Mytilus edulis TaxID=6550 RepID=A0A8S3VFB7_MYTED|nr:unnamed protein product [Mytilus edulis]
MTVNEISDKLTGVGKAVDSLDPIPAIQMQRVKQIKSSNTSVKPQTKWDKVDTHVHLYESIIALEISDSNPTIETVEDITKAFKNLNEIIVKSTKAAAPAIKMGSYKKESDSIYSEKIGTLFPVFKNKGDARYAKNYRGITVTPIYSKIIEKIIKLRENPIILEKQNLLQRGFTENTTPLLCELIIEEFERERKDLKLPTCIALLDGKSAFDVFVHSNIMRRLDQTGMINP